MNQLPPPIGANRIDEPDDSDRDPAVPGASARVRFLAAAVVLAMAIGAGVVGYRVIAGDDDSSGTGVAVWNAIAVQDFELSGEITIFDRDGEELERYDSGVEPAPSESSGPYLLIGGSQDEAEIVDTRSGERRELTMDEGEQAHFIAPASSIVAIHQIEGGNVRLIDAESGAVVDVGDVGELADPRLLLQAAQFDPGTGVVGLIDEGSFQSLLIEVQDDEEPTFLPGRVVDIGFASVVAVQPVGPRTTVTLYDAVTGDELGGVDTDRASRVFLTDSDTALVVTGDGELLRVNAGQEEPAQVASFDVDVSRGLTLDMREAQRVVLDDRDGSVVVAGWDGEEILRAEGAVTLAMRTSIDAMRCIVVVTENDGDDSPLPGGQVAQLFDIETGEPVGERFEIRPDPLYGSADGCAVSGTSNDGSAVFTNADVSTKVEDATGQVSPDGEAFLVRGKDGALELRRFDDLDADPVELPAGLPSFVDRS